MNVALRCSVVVVVVAAMVGACAAWAGEADASGGGWRCERMDVVIDLTRAAEGTARIEGEMRLALELEASMGPTVFVNRRREAMRFVEASGPEGTTAELNATNAEWEHSMLLHVRAAEAYARGDEAMVRFVCENDGDAFQWKVSEEIACASWTEGWLPSMTPGPDGTRSADLMRSTGRTTFKLPAGWRAITNGRLLERTERADGATEVWETEQRVARSFAAGPYEAAWHDVNGRKIGVYLLSAKPMGVDRQVDLLARALAAQEARFGPYPYPTYAIAEIPDGAMEWYASSEQGFIMAASRAFEYAHGNLPLWGHEMAHGWWGNLVGTTGPGAILCSESLAQYSAVVAIEAVDGEAAATEFLRFSREGYSKRQCARGYFEMIRDGQDRALSLLDNDFEWRHNLSDAKGHWVYHMLRGRVGDEVFFATLRGLIETFARRDISLNDVRAAFIMAAPDAELETFFAQWLDRPGAPVLDAAWSDGELVITQAQGGEPYDLRLDVALQLADGSTERRTVRITERETRFAIDPGQSVTSVMLDPDHRLLIWTPEYGERPSTE